MKKKAKILRLERRQKKLAAKGIQNSDIEVTEKDIESGDALPMNCVKKVGKSVEKDLEMLLNEVPTTSQHKLEVNHFCKFNLKILYL